MAANAAEGKATEAEMWRLHKLLLTALIDGLEHPPPGGCRATFLEVARAFAKDNGIIGGAEASAGNSLAEQLRALAQQQPEDF